MSGFAIKAENIAKAYRIGGRADDYHTLRDVLAGAAMGPVRAFRSLVRRNRVQAEDKRTIWALRDVSFEVKSGEIVGIIGRNGAGKSTLLKVLSRITAPTKGWARIRGRVGSLLEVGTGFHGELTGRENTYLNGAILGMKKMEIDRKFDEIVAFAEVDEFIDTPVKHYSSGTYMRLAFAVAAHLEPEILFVDEVLAVGDVLYQKKCLRFMDNVAKAGRTVLLVSHDMAAIESLCQKAFLLDRGRLTLAGDTRQVIDAYLSSTYVQDVNNLATRTDRQGDGKIRFTNISVRKKDGSAIDVIQCGQEVEFSISYVSRSSVTGHLSLYLNVLTLSGQQLLLLGNAMLGTNFGVVPDQGEFSCVIERFPLLQGQYSVTLLCTINDIVADCVPQATEITVEGGDFYRSGVPAPQNAGGMLIPHRWRVTE